MSNPSDKEIASMLVGIISDGFNRSLSTLAKAGAIDTKKMSAEYKGVGSKFYDLVTEQIELTAKYGTPGIRKLFERDDVHSK